jgi:hypothetical protein
MGGKREDRFVVLASIVKKGCSRILTAYAVGWPDLWRRIYLTMVKMYGLVLKMKDASNAEERGPLLSRH